MSNHTVIDNNKKSEYTRKIYIAKGKNNIYQTIYKNQLSLLFICIES